jgi:hypothetical protein
MSKLELKSPVAYFFFSPFILSFLHLLVWVYIVWATSPSPSPNPSFPGRTCSALFSDFVEEKT